MWCADSLLHHGEEELPVRGLPQLVPRLPRGQQHLQHPQGVAWHLQAPGGDQESRFGALLMDVQSAITFLSFRYFTSCICTPRSVSWVLHIQAAIKLHRLGIFKSS
jgi:hypothetical protein